MFALYTFVPLLVIELFGQFRIKSGYIFNFLSNTRFDKYLLAENGFHAPNASIINQYKTIYPDYKDLKNIRFNTDEFGTIEPSSFRSNRSKIDESVLFCGGSTTETVVVREGSRVPDIFSSITQIPAVNAGKSGKDLSGCIKSIEFTLKNIGKPKSIVIANNVNTLPNFAQLRSGQSALQIHSKYQQLLEVKKVFRSVLPGVYMWISHIKNNLMRNLGDNSLVTLKSSLPPYEIGLQKGCCHGASRFNKTDESPRFDWNNSQNLRDYYNFVTAEGEILKTMLSSYDYKLENIVVFMEPNSFLNSKTSGLYDFRQFLSNSAGETLSGLDSSMITNRYDGQYKHALASLGFTVLEVNPADLKSDYFYDAVHLSPAGSEYIGRFYAINLRKMLE